MIGGNLAASPRTSRPSLLLRPLPGNPVTDLARYQKLITEVIKPRLAQVPGVSNVNMQSERQRQVQIDFDPFRAAALGVSVDKITTALSRAQDSSAGFSDVGRRQLTVRFTGREAVPDLGGLILGWSNDRPIYLRDLAETRVDLADQHNYTCATASPRTTSRAVAQGVVMLIGQIDPVSARSRR